MGLEEDIAKEFKQLKHIAKWAVKHPKTSGVLASISYLLGEVCVSTAQGDPSSGNTATQMGVGLGTYWGLKLINEYVLGNRDVIQSKEKKGLLKRLRNPINKLEHLAFNNPAFSSFLPGAALLLLLNYGFEHKTLDWTLEEFVSVIPWLYAPAHLTLDMRRANEFFKRAYSRLKSNNFFVRCWDFVVERPILSAGAVGLRHFYLTLDNLDFPLQNEPASVVGLAALASSLYAAATYAGHTVAAGLFHSSSIKLAFKNLGISIDNLMGNYASAIDSLEDVLELPTSPNQKARTHVKIADLYSKKEEFDRVFSHIKKSIDLSDEKKTSLTPFEWIWTIPNKAVDIIKYGINGLKNTPIAKTQQSVFDLKRKKFDYAIARIDNAISLASDETQFSVIKALELTAMEKPEEANKVWIDILPDLHQYFEVISNTSKKVCQINEPYLADEIIIANDSNIEGLQAEYGFTRFSRDCYTDKRRIPKPLAFFILSESDFDHAVDLDLFQKPAYFVNSRIKGKVLSSKDINKFSRSKVLELYFDFVDRVTKHKNKVGEYSVQIPVLNYGETLVEKCLNRIPVDAKKKARLFENSESFITYLTGCKRSLIHGNFHPGNIIRGEAYCIIDFGDMCLALDTLGVEQFIAEFAFNKQTKIEIYESCHDFDSVKRSKDNFMEDGLMGSVFQAACLLGRSYKYKEGNPITFQSNVSHSLNALLHLNIVKGKEKDQLRYFRDDINSLQFN